jgi:hypothetical protein
MFQRKPLNSAVVLAFGAMAAVTANVSADSALFPQIAISDTITTIVSVINTTDDLYDFNGDRLDWEDRNGQGYLHYRMYYKQPVNANPCEEYNVWLPTSINDIQTIDLGATTGNGVLFEGTSGSKNPWDSGDNYALGTEARRLVGGGPIRGILLVDNAESDSPSCEEKARGGMDACMAPEGTSLFGEAIVLDFLSGSSWGYAAFTRQDDSNINPLPDYDDEFDYEDAASLSGWPVHVLPSRGMGTATTAFMVTPVISPRGVSTENEKGYPDSDMSEEVNTNTAYLRFAFNAEDGSPQVLFDRDETPASGARTRAVTCVGRVNVPDMFSDSGTVPTNFLDGGWGRLANWAIYSYTTKGVADIAVTKTAKAEDAAIIFKLEYGEAFDGYDTLGGYNNGVLIPNRSTVNH